MFSEDVEPVAVPLTDDERRMLVLGLNQWGGPAHGTEALAMAMGFSSLQDLDAGDGDRILDAIASDHSLSVRDWTRALVATEIAFVSAVVGSAGDWTAINGGTDSFWIGVLRRLQSKVPFDGHLLE